MIYIMTCGCHLTEDTIKLKVNGTYYCPEHPKARVKLIQKKCADCPTILTLTPRHAKTERCAPCRAVHNKKVQKEINRRKELERAKASRKRLELKLERIQAAADTWDCIHRDQCLENSWLNSPRADCLPCYGCKNYHPDRIRPSEIPSQFVSNIRLYPIAHRNFEAA